MRALNALLTHVICETISGVEKNNNDISLTSRAYAREKDFVFSFAGTYNLTSNHP